MPEQDSFQQSFEQLRSLLKSYEPSLHVQTDEPDSYYLAVPDAERNRKGTFFGAVRRRKTYVSFHLTPIYQYPDLLEHISPELRTRMQGRSCFNFKRLNARQLDELARLTQNCLERYRAEGLA